MRLIRSLKSPLFIIAALLTMTLTDMTPAQAAVAVGQVLVASGDNSAVQADGVIRVLQRKSEFYAGEIIKTGVASRMQLKFMDGALMSLRPNTEFRVNEYRFDATRKENNSSFMDLLKGGLRTLTGLIAQQNSGGYRLTTPVATIGVRGTDLEAVLDNGLSVAFWDGGGTVSNNTGSVELGAGADYKFAQVLDENSLPVPSLAAPPALFDSTPPAADDGTTAGIDAGGDIVSNVTAASFDSTLINSADGGITVTSGDTLTGGSCGFNLL